MNGLKYTFFASGLCYLYFQEEFLSKIITEVQEKYYKYESLWKENREIFEINEQRKKLDHLFEPELRIAFLNEKIGRQLNALEPFEGDFVSLFVTDKFQQLKENGTQIYFTQKGGGKTMEGLRIAKTWKEQEGPVLFFDTNDYIKNDFIFEKYGFKKVSHLKKVLKEVDSEPKELMKLNFSSYFQKFNKMIPLPLQTHPSTEASSTNAQEKASPLVDEKKKLLLIVIDDADELRSSKTSENFLNDNSKKEFVLQLKELVREGLAKVLFLCREPETQRWIKEEFDAGVWQGINKGSPDLRSNPVVEKYLNYISELTGIRMQEAEKFFNFFGVDFNAIVDLKHYIQKYKEAHKPYPITIDGLIEEKVEETKHTFREKNIDQTIMKVCKNLDKNWKRENLKAEEREKLDEFFGPNDWRSMKYKIAAYSICDKPWKNLLKE